MRAIHTLLMLATCALLMSCAAQPHQPPLNNFERYGTVAIVPAKYQPETQFITFARGPVSGGIKGGLEGGWSYSALPHYNYDEHGINPLDCYLDDIPDIRYYRFHVADH